MDARIACRDRRADRESRDQAGSARPIDALIDYQGVGMTDEVNGIATGSSV